MKSWNFRLFAAVAIIALAIGAALPSRTAHSAPAALPRGPVTDHYIVQLTRSARPADVANAFGLQRDFTYDAVFNGFAGYIPAGRLKALQNDPRVISVVQDQYVGIADVAEEQPLAIKPTATKTRVPTSTPTATPTSTPTATPTATLVGGPTATSTVAPTATSTVAPTATSTAAPSTQVLPTGIRRIGGGSISDIARANLGNIAVAVIDTGIYAHPDLKVVGGYNCQTGTSYSDGNGHGTHVSGTIGALDNTFGVVGVAPGVPLYAVRVLDNTGSGTWSSVICGINWVAANAAALNIKVANMSLGGTGSEGSCTDGGMHQAICTAVNNGVTFSVAAGNSAADASTFVPATYNEVIAVSALADYNGLAGGGAAPTCSNYGADDTFASFSNYGADVDIAAPGVCILSTWNNGGYNTISGTSMASPHVAGAAALYIAGHPGLTPAQVKSALISSWTPGPISGDPDAYPEGLLNVTGY